MTATLQACIEESLPECSDTEVIELQDHPLCGQPARAELLKRPDLKRALDATRQKRRAFTHLLAMAHSENKAERASARFLLKRDHDHSLP